MSREVILTGLRSNSSFHIGNYLGAIQPMVNMQKNLGDKYQINMFVPDLHSFTTPIDHGSLYKQTIENLRVYAAAGLNLEDANTYIYRQSYVPAHSELAWILGNFTYFGELSRMTQFKEKATVTSVSGQDNTNSDDEGYERVEKNVSAGLFNYPVLMAADILLYDAVWVPVGEDQRQHLELTRDVAARFNNKFGEVFTVPKEWNLQLDFVAREKGARIRSLKNPDRKMSKSVDDPAGTIMLTDSPEEAAKKIMGATTDSVGKINYDWDSQPGVANLMQMLALLTGSGSQEIRSKWQDGTNYGELKTAVAEEVKTFLTDFQTKLSAVSSESLIARLKEDEKRTNEIANTKLLKVQQAVGLRP